MYYSNKPAQFLGVLSCPVVRAKSVTLQLTVESRVDRAENAQGLGWQQTTSAHCAIVLQSVCSRPRPIEKIGEKAFVIHRRQFFLREGGARTPAIHVNRRKGVAQSLGLIILRGLCVLGHVVRASHRCGSHRMGISPRIRWGSIFPGREWRTGALLITIPFLCKGPRLTYKVRSRVTVICKFFMATLFQTCLLTDDTINQQFYKLIIIKLRGREGKGTLVRKREWREEGSLSSFFT